MAMTAQEMIDRRWLRRKLGFWRVVAVLCLAAAVVGVPLALRSGSKASLQLADQIARVKIEGLITEDEELLKLLRELKDEKAVKAVILQVDSPGGTTVGGETIYRAARAIAEVKPVATEVGTLAASAGYMIAVAADHVVAHETSIVGSIGVIFQYVDASTLLGNVGVSVNAIKSAPMKAEPSPFNPAPEEAKAMIRRLVLDTFDWFVALVDERRALDRAQVEALSDGSIFSGRQALANGLVDALGGEEEVRRWFEKERGVPAALEIIERKPDPRDGLGLSLFASARSMVFSSLGLDPQARTLPEALTRAAGRLDGLLSLWQPSITDGPLR